MVSPFSSSPILPSSCSVGGLSSPEDRIKSVFIARNHSVQSLIVGAVAHRKLRLQVKDFQNTKLLSPVVVPLAIRAFQGYNTNRVISTMVTIVYLPEGINLINTETGINRKTKTPRLFNFLYLKERDQARSHSKMSQH